MAWKGDANKIIQEIYDPTNNALKITGAASTFTALTDTPADYTGSSGLFVRVNVGETGLEFTSVAGTGDVVGPASSLDDNFATFNGTTGKLIQDSGIPMQLVAADNGTALQSGGVISVNANPALIDITAAVGYVVDAHTDPANPVVTKVNYAGGTGIAITNIATTEGTFLSVDSTGTLVQTSVPPSSADRKDRFYIGAVGHPDNATVTLVNNFTYAATVDGGQSLADLSTSLGVTTDFGLEYSANGANLNIDQSAGRSYFYSVNAKNDLKTPNIIDTAGSAVTDFFYTWRDGSGNWQVDTTSVTVVEPGKWDDGLGGPTDPDGVVQPHQWTIQRIQHSPTFDEVFIHYGQEVFDTKAAAVAAASSAEWVKNPTIGDVPFRCSLVVKGDATDLSDPAQAVFVNASTIADVGLYTGPTPDGTSNLANFSSGSTVTPVAFTVTSDGVTVTANVERSGGGDVVCQFDDTNYVLDSTPAATVALTAGSDSSPTENWVYVVLVGGVPTLSANTTGFPTTETYIPIGTVLIQSATDVQSEGPYKTHAWTDHINNGGDEQGHLGHLNAWIRKQNATWVSGVNPTTTIVTNAGTLDDVYFSNAAGKVLQLHEQTFPAIDMSTPTNVHVVNDFTTPYKETSNLNTELTDSTGASMTGSRFSLVFWGSVNETTGESKLFVNLPSGTYNSDLGVIDDLNKYSNYNIPSAFKGTGFLIARVNLRHQATGNGTWTEVSTEDLRGQLPSIFAGGAAGTTTVFDDNNFRVQDFDDVTKQLAFEVAGVTTATTRTLSVPDRDGEIILSNSAINTQTGTSYTLALSDAGQIVEMNNAAANTITIPNNATTAFPIGTRIDVTQIGVGNTSFLEGAGVTLQSSGALVNLTGQWSGATLYKRGTDEWVLIGDLA